MEMEEGLTPPRFLFLVFTVFILCLASSSRACPEPDEPFQCGDYFFKYPFGRKNSGCGDPALQLDCDKAPKMPLLNINGYEYYVMEFPNPHNFMTIIDRNIFEGTCNPPISNQATQSPSGDQSDSEDRWKNLNLWKVCNVSASLYPLHKCNDRWYYGFIIPESSLTLECKPKVVHLVESLQGIDPLAFPDESFQINWTVHDECWNCHSFGGTCTSNISSTHCNCTNSPHPEKCLARKSQNKYIIIGCSIGGALLVAVLLLFIYYVRRRKASPTRGIASNISHYQGTDIEKGQKGYMLDTLQIFPYQELQQATNFFDEKNELGDGGFGTVYLGKLEDGRAVAVKRLYQDNSRRIEQFINEVQILSSLYHTNLVRLYGCTSPESPVLLLVYEYVPNGTLADHLHGSRRSLRGLPWGIRLKIALQTAQALTYLHSIQPPIFHRDVKSNNILLDEYLGAKVADFGLSRLVPLNVSHVTTAPQGTPGYVDPEYNQCFQLTEKSDVYSFGVVLVEIISAKVAVDTNRNRNEISLANMAIEKIRRGVLDELVDPDLKIENNHAVKAMVAAVAELAIECLARERDLRPSMKEVVARLQQIQEMLQQSVEFSKLTSISPTASPLSVSIMGSERSGQYWVPLSV
ncbi:hypothetical protein SUGI_0115740 [Cryptomeria japonica]|uniref:LEAF RUST 10 DISEASE-RESISTANCE LOCUS RECEPTOR-LIKE PROTEIN KINASE-like 1.2 n=1 Tax=Cryptomeria japonica TaxID=3369 RepID=UPI002408EDD9|nr:LEAF RUST 10 DISEASE-RESISTANCE LOCUS RECEPTOR-LIKE PROTEIN KINASE-like 1.2 [Cryptomeria japonica]GLJ09777.1 hypothetical protein SUGI_0115740 [Cryptomeria japonica]